MKIVKTWLIFSLIFFVGCDARHNMDKYRCSNKQWADVEKQTKFCIDNTVYSSSFCLSSSKSSLCDFIPVQITEAQDEKP